MDTAFRTRVEKPEVSQPKEHIIGDENVAQVETGVEVPYTDFETEHQKPYTVEHFELGDLWNDPQGGFTEEVGTIEQYIKHKIDIGELDNTVPAVKEELKNLEKMNNIKKEERTTIKLGTLAAYAKYLLEVDGIKTKVRKYGTNN